MKTPSILISTILATVTVVIGAAKPAEGNEYEKVKAFMHNAPYAMSENFFITDQLLTELASQNSELQDNLEEFREFAVASGQELIYSCHTHKAPNFCLKALQDAQEGSEARVNVATEEFGIK